jgi:hypothetical protein
MTPHAEQVDSAGVRTSGLKPLLSLRCLTFASNKVLLEAHSGLPWAFLLTKERYRTI